MALLLEYAIERNATRVWDSRRNMIEVTDIGRVFIHKWDGADVCIESTDVHPS